MSEHQRHMATMPMRGVPSDQDIDSSLNTLQRTLNLSPDQVTKIRQLAQNRRDQMKSIREQSEPKFRQLMMLLNQQNPDPATVGRATIELKSIHDQIRANQSDYEKQFSSILNPNQQQTVNQLRSQAQTFIALRRLGVIQPDFAHGLFSSGMNSPAGSTGNRER
jgi:Spy/CpxP family protein refolding chaperone